MVNFLLILLLSFDGRALNIVPFLPPPLSLLSSREGVWQSHGWRSRVAWQQLRDFRFWFQFWFNLLVLPGERRNPPGLGFLIWLPKIRQVTSVRPLPARTPCDYTCQHLLTTALCYHVTKMGSVKPEARGPCLSVAQGPQGSPVSPLKLSPKMWLTGSPTSNQV